MRRAALVAVVACVLTACSARGVAPAPSESSADNPAVTPTPASAAPSTPATTAPEPTAQAFFAPRWAVDDSIDSLRKNGRDADAELLATTMGGKPQTVWIGDWMGKGEAQSTARNLTTAAAAEGTIPTFAIYAIPGRDCGEYSAGGLSQKKYLDFVSAFAGGLEGPAWVVLEPDALPLLGECGGQGDRVALLAGAAEILDDAGARVYLDAGHSHWLAAEEAARRLELVGTEHLAGFALNTSNYYTTEDITAYGDKVAALTGLHYVVDTSRNGNGSNGKWCNPRGRALGEPARMVMEGYVDAYLWVKAPGESDGECNGGPAAGAWWLDVALELARNSQEAP